MIDAPGAYYPTRPHPLTREQWYGLPFWLRQKWLRETRFDREARGAADKGARAGRAVQEPAMSAKNARGAD
jgi:hypothetical protein